jgi:hypothetical protein
MLHFAYKVLICFHFERTFLIQKNLKLFNVQKAVKSVKLGFKPIVLSPLRAMEEKGSYAERVIFIKLIL